jgi:hypothetical protein
VISVKRDIQFPGALTAPTVGNIFRQLDAKYGPESTASHNGIGLMRAGWVFGTSSQTKCPPVGCPGADASMQPEALQSYLRAISQGEHVIITADAFPMVRDPTRVFQLSIVVTDQVNKAQTLSEALKQMEAAAKAAYDRNTAPQQGLKL